MKIREKTKDSVKILYLDGELEMGTVDFLVAKVLEMKEDNSKIILDFSGIDFVDSTGIGNMIKLFQDNQDLDYALTNLQPEVKDIFDILNLEEILGSKVFAPSNQKAVNYLESENN